MNSFKYLVTESLKHGVGFKLEHVFTSPTANRTLSHRDKDGIPAHLDDLSQQKTVTKAGLQVLMSAQKLDLGMTYLVTDPQQGGSMLLKAYSTKELYMNATWLRPTNLTAFGWIRITGGATGSVDSVIVNGLPITTASVPYITSTQVTATNAVANINANSAISGYRAVAMLDTIVIISTTAGANKNGFIVTGTSTILSLGNIQSITNGQDTTNQALDVIYDFSNDRVRECYDPIRNNSLTISESYRVSLTFDPFAEFRWGDDAFIGNTFNEAYAKDNYFVTANTVFGLNFSHKMACYNNVGGISSTTTLSQMMFCTNAGSLSNNLLLVAGANIGVGYSMGSITGNILSNGNASIRFFSSFSAGSFILNNTLSGSNSFIRFVTVTNNGAVSANVLSGSSSAIWGVSIGGSNGSSAVISGNVLSSANATIRQCGLYSEGASISNNVISSAGTNPTIRYCYLNGFNSTINGNIISSTSVATAGITSVYLNGYGSGINNMTFSVAANIANVRIDANGGVLTGVTFTSAFNSINGLTWDHNSYSFGATISGLSNVANKGAINSPISLGIVPQKFYCTALDWEGTGITSATNTAQIKVGLLTDNDSAGMPLTLITALNQPYGSPTVVRTKATVANRMVVVTPTVEAITAGTIKVIVTGRIGI